MTLDASTLRRWRELAEAATPDPWVADQYAVHALGDPFDGHALADCQMTADAAFIAATRVAVPVMAAHIDYLNAKLREWEAVAERPELEAAYVRLVDDLTDARAALTTVTHERDAIRPIVAAAIAMRVAMSDENDDCVEEDRALWRAVDAYANASKEQQ